MEALKNRLNESRNNLHSDGGAFVVRTRAAGLGLVDATRRASTTFLADTRKATLLFVGETREAGAGLVDSLQGEGRVWATFLNGDSGRWSQHLLPALSGESWGSSTLEPLKEALRAVRVKFARTDEEETTEALSVSRDEEVASAKAKPSAKRFPISGYDSLNAKEAASSLTALTAAQLRTVLKYERANKDRVSVTRVAERLLAN